MTDQAPQQATDQPAAPSATDAASETAQPKPKGLNRWVKRSLISLIAVIAVWSAIWFGYAKFLEHQAIQIITGGQQPVADNGGDPLNRQAAQERQFRYATISVGGYPFSFRIQVTAPEVEDLNSGARISADRAVIGFSLFEFRRFEWEAIGGLDIRLPVQAGRPGIELTHVNVRADQATGHFELGDTGASNPYFDIRQIVVRPGFGGLGRAIVQMQEDEDGGISLDVQPNTDLRPIHPALGDVHGVTLDRFTLELIQPVWLATQAGEPALTIDSRLTNLRPLRTQQLLNSDGVAPINQANALGQQVDEFGLRFTFTGPLPGGVHAYALGQWRDGGGAIDLDDFTVTVGEVSLDAKGAARLDAALQPEAEIDLTVKGHQALFDSIVESNRSLRGAVQMSQQLILPYVTTNEAGEEVIAANISVEDRFLGVGPLRFFQLPPVRWAGAQ